MPGSSALTTRKARRYQKRSQQDIEVLKMVMIDINEYMNDLQDEYNNSTAIGHASDHLDDSQCGANSYPKHDEPQVPGYDEILPCACEECLQKFLLEDVNDFNEEDYDDESPEEYLAENLDEATMEVIENLVFLGEGTTTKDVMISILSLEAIIAKVKLHLLESE